MKRGSLLLAVVVGPVGFVAGMTLAERPGEQPRFVPPAAPAAPVTSSTLPEPTGLATFSTLAQVTPQAPASAPAGEAQRPRVPAGAVAALPSIPALPSVGDPLANAFRQPVADAASRLQRAELYVVLARECYHLDAKQDGRRFLQAAVALRPAEIDWLGNFVEFDRDGVLEVLLPALARCPKPSRELLSLAARVDPAGTREVLLAILERGDHDRIFAIHLLHRLDPIEARRRAELLGPDNVGALAFLASVDPAGTIPRLEAALRAEPNGDALNTLIRAYHELGSPSAAHPWIDAALKAGDPVDAFYTLSELAEIDPAYALERWEALGKPTHDEDPYSMREFVNAYLQAGRQGEGLALARQIIEAEYAVDGASGFVSELIEERPSDGLALAHQLLAENPSDGELRSEVLWALFSSDRDAEAVALSRQWIDELQDPAALRRLANDLGESEHGEEQAVRAWKRAAQLDPRNLEPIRALIELEAYGSAFGLAAQAGASKQTAVRVLVREGLRQFAESDEPAGISAWLARFPDHSIQEDVDFLTELVESLAGRSGLRAEAQAIAQRALAHADPEEAKYVRELLEDEG